MSRRRIIKLFIIDDDSFMFRVKKKYSYLFKTNAILEQVKSGKECLEKIKTTINITHFPINPIKNFSLQLPDTLPMEVIAINEIYKILSINKYVLKIVGNLSKKFNQILTTDFEKFGRHYVQDKELRALMIKMFFQPLSSLKLFNTR